MGGRFLHQPFAEKVDSHMSIVPEIPEAFKRLFAGWVRIEPRCRSDNFATGLQARTADPLWLLGRQWQFGEFAGEDAGSPSDFEVNYRIMSLTHLILRDENRREEKVNLEERTQNNEERTQDNIERRTWPIEMLVEREPVELENDWRMRVRVGQQFERYCHVLSDMASDVIALYRNELGIVAPSDRELVEIDRATQRYRRLMAGRAVDGWRLRKAREDGTLPATPMGADMSPIFASLDQWWTRLYNQPTDDPVAWRPQRLDYEFSAAARPADGDEVRISVPSYRNGDFDWHSCVVENEPVVFSGEQTARHFSPTRVSFAGMPHPRWWAFEDAKTNFGALDAATTDVAKLALMEFALVYGDDWFIIPLEVCLGSLTKITLLQVTDAFGQIVEIPHARTVGGGPLYRWEMYALDRLQNNDGNGGGADFLFVPPAVGFREESKPIEEVRFLRDEGANMVWGVEHLVSNGLGTPVHGFDAEMERRARQRESVGNSEAARKAEVPVGLSYRLATTVPANWIPFLPANALTMLGNRFRPGIDAVRLLRAQMLRNEADQVPEAIAARTRLLDLSRSNPLLWLDEEAVPRDGVKVQLTKQRVRWTHGETYVWLGKKVLIGRGQGRSGLRSDVIRHRT